MLFGSPYAMPQVMVSDDHRAKHADSSVWMYECRCDIATMTHRSHDRVFLQWSEPVFDGFGGGLAVKVFCWGAGRRRTDRRNHKPVALLQSQNVAKKWERLLFKGYGKLADWVYDGSGATLAATYRSHVGYPDDTVGLYDKHSRGLSI
mgnify:CR=1 FL=1